MSVVTGLEGCDWDVCCDVGLVVTVGWLADASVGVVEVCV